MAQVGPFRPLAFIDFKRNRVALVRQVGGIDIMMAGSIHWSKLFFPLQKKVEFLAQGLLLKKPGEMTAIKYVQPSMAPQFLFPGWPHSISSRSWKIVNARPYGSGLRVQALLNFDGGRYPAVEQLQITKESSVMLFLGAIIYLQMHIRERRAPGWVMKRDTK